MRRLRAAGAVIIAKTNMSEFAFSGVGANPHYGTPGNPADRARVPGGSSSGAAVAAADGMCQIAIGSDTGGSTRIPAGLCGIVGYKPSKWRVPTDGAFPLSYTLDSIGPLARTVADCALADAVMAGEEPRPLEPLSVAGLRLAVPVNDKLHPVDATVSAAFTAGRGAAAQGRRARQRGAVSPLSTRWSPPIPKGGLSGAGGLFDPSRAAGDPRRRDRSDHPRAHRSRRNYSGRRLHRPDPHPNAVPSARSMLGCDEMARRRAASCRRRRSSRPGSPMSRRRKAFEAANVALLSNTSIGNFFDLCAISVPLPVSGLPVGLMLVARNGRDAHLFRVAAGVERLWA